MQSDKAGDGAGRGATSCWRVEFLGNDRHGAPIARLIAVYDSGVIPHDDFTEYVNEIDSRLRRRLPREEQRATGRSTTFWAYGLEPVALASLGQLSVQQAIDCPMITFDHLSPAPRMDEDGETPVLELRDEDVL